MMVSQWIKYWWLK